MGIFNRIVKNPLFVLIRNSKSSYKYSGIKKFIERNFFINSFNFVKLYESLGLKQVLQNLFFY